MKKEIPDLSTLDITKRCGYKIGMKTLDFCEEITPEKVRDLMQKVISWQSEKPLIEALKISDKKLKLYNRYTNLTHLPIPESLIKTKFTNIQQKQKT